MLSTQFATLLARLSGRSEASYLFLSVIDRLQNATRSFLEEANSNATKPQHFNIQNFVVTSVRNITNDVDLWRLYDSARSYLDGLRDLDVSSGETEGLANELSSRTQKFLEHYKRYMIARDYSTSFDLMLLAQEMYPLFAGLGAASDLAAENFGEIGAVSDAEIEIYSSSKIDEATDYVKVLIAFGKIYTASARLLDVDPEREPLQVSKIESGSLLLKLKGAVGVVRLMTEIIKRAVKYGAMHHSLTGRIENLPKAADAVTSVLQLRESLAKCGIDISGMDQEIESAALKIAKQTNLLMTRLDDIGLNGEFLMLKEQLLIGLEKGPQKLLTHEDVSEG